MLMWKTNYLYEGGILNISTLTPQDLFYPLKTSNGLHLCKLFLKNVYDIFEKTSINIIALLAAFQSMLVYL